MNPHDEEEVAKAIFVIETAIEALHEISVEMLKTLQEINLKLGGMNQNIAKLVQLRPIT